ncbi:hypothetical protein ACFY71_40470 [Streptomyces cinerochromogenes]|uniref:hypothetical protein n=1 Tax=Streptomyces cinerochromogenes TaxID=66422 RepID=UPI003697FA8D
MDARPSDATVRKAAGAAPPPGSNAGRMWSSPEPMLTVPMYAAPTTGTVTRRHSIAEMAWDVLSREMYKGT